MAGLLGFWLVAAGAAWVQTLAGFGLGLILMAATGLFGFLPLPQAAAVTSILVIVNTGAILWRGWPEVDRQALWPTLAGAAPGLVLGFVALDWLAGNALVVLRLILGVVIIVAALQAFLAGRPRPSRSGAPSFVVTGFFGAIMGGLFATSGPPIIWQMYRQPLPLSAIRSTLIAVFMTTQILRVALLGGSGGMTAQIGWATLGAAPAVLLGTWAARRHPPRISAGQIRRMAQILLAVSGIALLVPALVVLVA